MFYHDRSELQSLLWTVKNKSVTSLNLTTTLHQMFHSFHVRYCPNRLLSRPQLSDGFHEKPCNLEKEFSIECHSQFKSSPGVRSVRGPTQNQQEKKCIQIVVLYELQTHWQQGAPTENCINITYIFKVNPKQGRFGHFKNLLHHFKNFVARQNPSTIRTKKKECNNWK